jgi:O-antigen/teichoic acid export membrane protein
VVYSIFVANTVVGYLMAHKYSLINSDQKQYKLAGYNLSYQIGLYLVKIAILYYLKNYILFLACEFFFNVGYNLLVVKKVNSLYPYITTKKRYTIDADTRRNIVKNVKALFLYSIGGYLLHSTDNLLISSFVGISIVGLYSNYTLIINQLKTLANQVFTGLKDSVGNLVASECPVRRLQVFNALYLMNFLIVSLIVIVLYNTLNPFVMWWLGGEYVLPDSILIVACMNLYIDMIRSSIMVYKTVSGIFDADKYVVLITAAINLAASLLLVKDYGLLGILLGTFISIILTASWNWPRLVYKYTFKRSPLEYYLKFVLYALVTIALCAVTRGLNDAILHADAGINIWNICLRGLVSLALTILAYFVIFHRTPSYKYLENSITQLIKSRYGK